MKLFLPLPPENDVMRTGDFTDPVASLVLARHGNNIVVEFFPRFEIIEAPVAGKRLLVPKVDR